MRYVNKDFQNPPAALKSQEALDSLNLVLADKHNISRKIYRQAQEELLSLYHRKCAYCEFKECNPEIEHYRPKKMVIRAGDVKGKHKGYFWLCYEWSNLLPACHACNKQGSGKGNKFPIIDKSKRLRKPPLNADGQLDFPRMKADSSPLIDEQPYLLHPEIDDPKQFFKFTNKGKMLGTDLLKRGNKTISICNLNRDNLIFFRQEVINDIVKEMNKVLVTYYELKTRLNEIVGNALHLAQNQLKDDLRSIFEKFDARQAPDQTFTLLAWYLRTNFEDILLPLIPGKKHKNLIGAAFRQFQQGRL